MPHSILILEPHSLSREARWAQSLELPEMFALRRAVWSATSANDLRLCRDDLVLVNAVPQSEEADKLFCWLRDNPHKLSTLAIIPREDRDFLRLAASAVDDFLLWPAENHELLHRVVRLLGPAHKGGNACAVPGEPRFKRIVGRDPAFLQVMEQANIVAGAEAPVLLTGETGTGKELCAQAIHLMSRRQNGAFVPVECGALPEHLFENELFGHVRGAFTDAHADQGGLAGMADGGTLFLDEIDALSLATQAKVLRLLQENTFRALGATQYTRANLRVIAATNTSLEQLVREKRFRSDLFFRLNVLRIQLPALRERPSDIGLLARHFINEICSVGGLPRKVLSPAALRKLESYAWCGNVRELHNIIQRAVLWAPGPQITPAHLDIPASAPQEVEPSSDFRTARTRAIESFERDYVQRLLEKHGGNITQAAMEAHKDRRVFGRLAKKYRVGRDSAA